MSARSLFPCKRTCSQVQGLGCGHLQGVIILPPTGTWIHGNTQQNKIPCQLNCLLGVCRMRQNLREALPNRGVWFGKPWCWVDVKSQLFWRLSPGPTSLLVHREYEMGNEVLVWVWGQPGFPRCPLNILFFPSSWHQGRGIQEREDREGSSSASLPCPWLPSQNEIYWKELCWLMEKLKHAPAGFGKSSF